MDFQVPRPTHVSSIDVTLDALPREGPDATTLDSSSGSGDRVGQVALVEGSGPELTRETETLLRRRLRLAAAVLFLGYLVFLPQHYFQTDLSLPGSTFLIVFHTMAIVLFAALAALLYRDRTISLPRLRMIELAMFAFSATFLASVEHFSILRQCRELCQVVQVTECGGVHLALPVGLWLLLIFTYALFVPNTWHRAAIVIGILAAVPVVMIGAMMWYHAEVREILDGGEVAGFVLTIAVASVTGLFGVDTIGSLRQEAFEAKQLGQYRLKRRIGVGGMGEVYLAEHQLMRRPCVMKLIRPDKAGDPRVLRRFHREVRATAKLSHWNTVEIFDYGSTEDGTFYYVMEYLPGMSLADLVDGHGPLPPERVIYLLRQACDALSEAHASGLIHRDIKPGNIFAAQRGGIYDVAKLLDFGLVKPMFEEQQIHLTTEGSITGSPLYISPEQVTANTSPDARSDIYSLGAVGYFLLTGRPPFTGETPIQVLIAHAHEDPVPLSKRREGIPEDINQVILRCLAKSPEDRYSSAAELAEALTTCSDADRWTRAQAAQWWLRYAEETEIPT